MLRLASSIYIQHTCSLSLAYVSSPESCRVLIRFPSFHVLRTHPNITVLQHFAILQARFLPKFQKEALFLFPSHS